MMLQVNGSNWRRAGRRFREAGEGTVAVSFALLATAFFAVVALSVDVARGQNLAARLTNALDAAAMAGARALDRGDTDEEVKTAATAFFQAQLANVRLHSAKIAQPVVIIDREKGAVGASVDADLGTTFGAFTGTNTIQISKSSSVVYRARDVELALALDSTGSMNDGSKLADMRSAAKDILDILFAEAKTERSVRVAVVPWAASVNAGALARDVSGGTSSDGCVVERQNGETDDSYPTGNAAMRSVTEPYGYYSCQPNAVMPLTGKSRNADIRATLDAISPMGGTAGHIGMSWAWYLLSPSWAGLMPTGSEPAAYAPKETLKAVLLLSDGEFNLSYLSGASEDVVAMSNESYSQFDAICAGMKQNGITVFTVALGALDGRSQSELRGCASSDQHYFEAASSGDLKQAFKSVAQKLKRMRLTK